MNKYVIGYSDADNLSAYFTVEAPADKLVMDMLNLDKITSISIVRNGFPNLIWVNPNN